MAKTAAWVFGVIFVIAGIWGFFAQPAVGFIGANVLSSLIHLVVGVILLVVAGKSSVGTALKTVGIIYVVWAILGMLGWGAWSAASDSTTNWFYLVVGVVIAAIGFFGSKKGGMATMPPASAPQM